MSIPVGFRKNRTEALILPPTHVLSIRQRETAEALERNSLQELQLEAVLNDSTPNDEQLGYKPSLPLTPPEGTPSYSSEPTEEVVQKSKKTGVPAETKQKKTTKNVGAKKNKKEPGKKANKQQQ